MLGKAFRSASVRGPVINEVPGCPLGARKGAAPALSPCSCRTVEPAHFPPWDPTKAFPSLQPGPLPEPSLSTGPRRAWERKGRAPGAGGGGRWASGWGLSEGHYGAVCPERPRHQRAATVRTQRSPVRFSELPAARVGTPAGSTLHHAPPPRDGGAKSKKKKLGIYPEGTWLERSPLHCSLSPSGKPSELRLGSLGQGGAGKVELREPGCTCALAGEGFSLVPGLRGPGGGEFWKESAC